MTAKEKTKLVMQAGKLYTLGLAVEKHKEKLRRLVEKDIPNDSEQMKIALAELQMVNTEWKRLEQEHLEYRNYLKIGTNFN